MGLLQLEQSGCVIGHLTNEELERILTQNAARSIRAEPAGGSGSGGGRRGPHDLYSSRLLERWGYGRTRFTAGALYRQAERISSEPLLRPLLLLRGTDSYDNNKIGPFQRRIVQCAHDILNSYRATDLTTSQQRATLNLTQPPDADLKLLDSNNEEDDRSLCRCTCRCHSNKKHRHRKPKAS